VTGILAAIGCIGQVKPLTVSIDPASIFTNVPASATCNADGLPPHTYFWQVVAGDALNLGSPTGKSTTIGPTLPNSTSTLRCTVTDSAGRTAYASIPVSFFTVVPP
jgi:hypothetical protein